MAASHCTTCTCQPCARCGHARAAHGHDCEWCECLAYLRPPVAEGDAPKTVPIATATFPAEGRWRQCLSCGSVLGHGIESHTLRDCVADSRRAYDVLVAESAGDEALLREALGFVEATEKEVGYCYGRWPRCMGDRLRARLREWSERRGDEADRG